jgi:pyruvate dehydrogenase E2 component (dihydrolipoamide acetyltransferase)
MPKFDMDQETAVISAWLKNEGDSVQLDEPVLTVETDKVAIDVPAPAAGVLAGICAEEGERVAVAAVIAYILQEGETRADLPQEPAAGQASTAAAALPPAAPREANGAPASSAAATPVAVRIAEDLGVDLAQVLPRGPRITRQDVEQYVAAQGTAVSTRRVQTAATPAARRLARETAVPLAGLPGSGPRGRVQAHDVSAAAAAAPAPMAGARQTGERAAQVVPLTGMRRIIAERMQSSFHDIPHIALTVEVDVTNLEAMRARLNKRAADQGDRKLSMTALLVYVTAWALKRHPFMNASLAGEEILLWEDVNIGVAVAVDEGLIVPVIRQAHQKSTKEIGAELQKLAAGAQAGKLSLPDVQQGTFTISNLGMFGIQQFRAIINPPESAILAVGKTTRKPVVINDQDEVAVRPMMTLTLSADHRLLDGVVVARFLADLAQAIEAPDILHY